MAIQEPYDELDAKDTDESLAIQDFCVKIFYLLEKTIDTHQPKIELQPLLDNEERIYLSNKIILNYNKIGIQLNKINLSHLIQKPTNDYNKFIQNYYNI